MALSKMAVISINAYPDGKSRRRPCLKCPRMMTSTAKNHRLCDVCADEVTRLDEGALGEAAFNPGRSRTSPAHVAA
jgi:hypothetical protein